MTDPLLQHVDCELVCECGIRFKCPRCDATPYLRVIASGVIDRCGNRHEVPLESTQPRSAELPPLHPFAQRAEANDAPEYWLPLLEAAALVGTTPKTFTMLGAQLAVHVRRRRFGRAFR